ncbi:hypothetical protein MSPP1_003554 [Malassezia sp. CBS 17886]|nr:hypothetical protein MSPP1_003554 [Malassezia sp. CBS 17886]
MSLSIIARSTLRRAVPRALVAHLYAARAAVPAVPHAARAACVPAASRGLATERDPSVSLKDPSEEEAQKMLESGTLALESGDLAKAKADYGMSIKVHENSSAYYNLGVVLYQEHDLEGAIGAWADALRVSPDSPDAHTNIASAYIMSQPSRPDKAVDHLKIAAEQAPDDPEIHFNLGAVLEALEQLEGAVGSYKRAAEGGIERANENVRNCEAKIIGARVELHRVEEEQKRSGGGAQ